MQTWLVQIPPGVDISEAKEIKDGEFQIGKHKYILTPAPVSIGDCITIEEDDGKYQQAAGPTKLMELTKSVSLPKIDKSVKQAKPLVPQRTNLKPRHFATGYGPEPEKSQKRHINEESTAPSPKKQKISRDIEPKTPKSEKKRKSKSEKTPKSEKKKKSKTPKSEKKSKPKSA